MASLRILEKIRFVPMVWPSDGQHQNPQQEAHFAALLYRPQTVTGVPPQPPLKATAHGIMAGGDAREAHEHRQDRQDEKQGQAGHSGIGTTP